LKRELFDWQKQCLARWFARDCRGIVNVVTGGGKTVLALHAARMLEERLTAEGRRLKVKIVVPKTFLVAQWRRAIREELEADREEIGCYFGGRKDNGSRHYMVYVMNSARYSLSRHILADLREGWDVLLVVDECHHCVGEINGKIFDFIPRLTHDMDRYHALGLTATAGALEDNPRALAALGGVIYRYGFSDALEQGIVSPFVLFHVGVDFTPEEQADYADISEQLIIALARLKKACPRLKGLRGRQFYAGLERLAQGGDATAALAGTVKLLAIRRKELLHLAQNRISCACRLVERLPQSSKIILFGERIETAQRIFRHLKLSFPGETALYHSGMDPQAAKTALQGYQSGEARILVSCRALDEGLNIPATDVGIVVSSTAGERQRIQRLGRILRPGAGAGPAGLYYLHMRDSGEEPEYMGWLADEPGEGAPAVELFYDAASDSFACPLYTRLADRVLANQLQQGADSALRRELERNLALGMTRCDWWMNEDACRERIAAADGQAQRNYWIGVLLMIRARTGGVG